MLTGFYTSKISDLLGGEVVGKDGQKWWTVHHVPHEGEEKRLASAGISPNEGEVVLFVQFPDGGIDPRIIPDQEVEVYDVEVGSPAWNSDLAAKIEDSPPR